MLTRFYPQILGLHIACVTLSGALFFIRGMMRLGGWPQANRRALRLLSYAIDSTLLAAAILLAIIIRQYPLVQAWLTVKLALLPLYIVLGSYALKRARTQRTRLAAFIGAVATYLYIVGVAVAHHPLGLFSAA